VTDRTDAKKDEKLIEAQREMMRRLEHLSPSSDYNRLMQAVRLQRFGINCLRSFESLMKPRESESARKADFSQKVTWFLWSMENNAIIRYVGTHEPQRYGADNFGRASEKMIKWACADPNERAHVLGKVMEIIQQLEAEDLAKAV
jgi:hypothetical protein